MQQIYPLYMEVELNTANGHGHSCKIRKLETSKSFKCEAKYSHEQPYIAYGLNVNLNATLERL